LAGYILEKRTFLQRIEKGDFREMVEEQKKMAGSTKDCLKKKTRYTMGRGVAPSPSGDYPRGTEIERVE